MAMLSSSDIPIKLIYGEKCNEAECFIEHISGLVRIHNRVSFLTANRLKRSLFHL